MNFSRELNRMCIMSVVMMMLMRLSGIANF